MPPDRPGPLRLVQKPALAPKEEVRRRVRRHPKPAAMLQCHRCGGREVVEARSGVLVKDGKPVGGTKALLCAMCFARGERVVLL